jgi:metal-sulfur cluster biosynthetic enzyme
MMPAPTVELQDDIRACLREIKDPCSVATGHPLHLEEMGLVRSVEVDTGASRAIIDLRLTSPTCVMVGYFVTEIEKLVREVAPQITDVEVRFDQGFEWTPDMMSEDVKRARAERFALMGSGPRAPATDEHSRRRPTSGRLTGRRWPPSDPR